MKLNVFMLIIALIVGALIFYGFYSGTDRILLSVGSAVVCAVSLALALGTDIVDYPRTTTMFRVVAGLLFFAFLILDLLFWWFEVADAKFIIFNGILAVIGAVGLYTIGKSRQ